MVIVGLHIGIVGGDFLECPPPKVVPVGENIGFGDEGQHFSLGVIATLRVLKRPTNTPFTTLAAVEGGLARHLVRSPLFEKSADAAVQVFGILADHHEIDILGPLSRQRGLDPGQQFDRPEVDVLVEPETQIEQKPFFQNARGDVGMSHRAEIDGVKRAEFVDRPVRQYLAGFQIPFAPEIEIDGLVGKVFSLGDRF